MPRQLVAQPFDLGIRRGADQHDHVEIARDRPAAQKLRPAADRSIDDTADVALEADLKEGSAAGRIRFPGLREIDREPLDDIPLPHQIDPVLDS